MVFLFLLREPEEFYKTLDFHGSNKYPLPHTCMEPFDVRLHMSQETISW